MLDIKFIRENQDLVKDGLAKKGVASNFVDKILEKYLRYREILKETEDFRHSQKDLGKENIEEAKIFKNKIKENEEALAILDKELEEAISELPNIPSDDTPIGKDEADNIVLKEVGTKPEFDFESKDYLEIAEKLDIIDVAKASEVTGSRFGYLKGDAALLEFALIKLALDKILPEKFTPVIPPVMIKPEVYKGMGRLSESQKEERYFLQNDNLYLVGSSEHTLGPLHMNDILKEKDLPKRYLGFSTCFRREAGSYGKDTKGILRVHQFDKVEMYCFSKPEESDNEQRLMVSLQEKIVQALELPYRIVSICTGDMGFTDYKQYDVEIWFPSQNKYRETHSCSNTTDFQTRGINAKYRKEADGKVEYLHSLNATAIALGRMIIAIIENYQQKDGSVKIPKVLQKYLGKDKIF